MFIEYIELYRFEHFKVNKIEKICLDLTSLIQLILGTNGCGKTKFLKECNPRPAIRSNYGKDGYKKICITHNGSTFILTTDFKKHVSPNSFLMDGRELNESGTSAVQEELIITHLGYTASLHDIVFGNVKIARMQPNQRKALLLDLNPADLNFILDDYKKVVGLLRATKNNLTMLYERKNALQNEILDESIKEELNKERTELNTTISKYVAYTYQLENYINEIKEKLNNSDPVYPSISIIHEMTEHYRKNMKYLYQYKDIPKINTEQVLIELENERSSLVTRREGIENTIRQTTDDLEKYTSYIRNSNDEDIQKALSDEIAVHQKLISSLKKYKVDNPFPEDTLMKISSYMHDIRYILTQFITVDSSAILTKEYIFKMRQHFERYQFKSFAYKAHVDEIHKKLDIINNDLDRTSEVFIPDDCKRSVCSLFLKYSQEETRMKNEKDLLVREMNAIQYKYLKYTSLRDTLYSRIEEYKTIESLITKLSQYLDMYPISMIVRGLNIIQILRNNPLDIYNKINEHLNCSMKYYELQNLEKDLDNLISKQKNQDESKVDKNFILEIIKDRETILTEAKKDYELVSALHENKLTEIGNIRSYQSYLSKVKNTQDRLKSFTNHELLKHELELSTMMYTEITNEKLKLTTRLSSIETTLREQELIASRYNKEILEIIVEIEHKKELYTILEKPLSPIEGIPHKYMVEFLNSIINIANQFIASVMSYSIAIDKLDINKPIDYKFAMTVEDVPIPTMAECSDAQAEIIDFAFTLALICKLNYTNYPLYLDEIGRTFDNYHKNEILKILHKIIEEGVVSQLFLINHNAAIYDGILNCDILVLNDENILLPKVYNENVVLEKY